MGDVVSLVMGSIDLPAPTLAPLAARLDGVGIVEYARGATPTADFGHCTDDAGRALGVAVQLSSDQDAGTVAHACLRQLGVSLRPDGRFTVRLDARGTPTRDGCSDDATARALWGLAHAASGSLGTSMGREAERLLAATAGFESEHPRSAAHAVLAGAVLLAEDATSAVGLRLLHDNVPHLPRLLAPGPWMWPEPRMTYGNGLLCEALLRSAWLLCDEQRVDEALSLLCWLVDIERSPLGHFSFTPTSGRGPGEGPGFDQQPIEAWTLASACRAAAEITHDPSWTATIAAIATWFVGVNDLGVQMWDPLTGAAFDGLTPTGPNLNEGTESTIALIGTTMALGSSSYAACSSETR